MTSCGDQFSEFTCGIGKMYILGNKDESEIRNREESGQKKVVQSYGKDWYGNIDDVIVLGLKERRERGRQG